MSDRVPTVAVVDDDSSALESIGDLLKSVGHAVLLFSSADALLMTDALQTVDCLVTDICLPGMSGLELEERARQQRPELPVVVLTAHDGAWEQAKLLANLEFDRFLFRKPVNGEVLIAAIRTALAIAEQPKPSDLP